MDTNVADKVVKDSNAKINNKLNPNVFIHPNNKLYRYSYLVLLCLLGTGNFFCFDVPGSLQERTLIDMDIYTSTFSLLYSVFSWSNIVTNIVGGFLIDRYFGIEFGAILCCCFTVLGQLMLGIGAYVDKFWLMLVARFIFSLGSDNLTLLAYMRAVKWFPESELNFVFGMQLSVNRFGSTICFIVMEPLYNVINQYISGYKCLGITFMSVSLLPAMDLCLALVLAFLDKRATNALKLDSNNQTLDTNEKKKNNDKISLKDVTQFTFGYWALILVIVFNYSAVFPFISLGIPFYKRKFLFSGPQANLINSSIYFISIFASPVMGAIIGSIGLNLVFILISVLTIGASHSLLAFTFLNPWIAITLMGIAYSIFACIVWALVSFVVPEHTLGTAFGIAQAVISLVLGSINLAVGYIMDYKGYLVLEMFFIEWILLTLVFMFALLIYDHNSGDKLNKRKKIA